jgi:hypothetical protein
LEKAGPGGMFDTEAAETHIELGDFAVVAHLDCMAEAKAGIHSPVAAEEASQIRMEAAAVDHNRPK